MGHKELRRHLPCIISIKLRLPLAAHNKYTHTLTLTTHCTNTKINEAGQMTARCQNKINARPASKRVEAKATNRFQRVALNNNSPHSHTRTRIDNNKLRALSPPPPAVSLSLSLHPFVVCSKILSLSNARIKNE